MTNPALKPISRSDLTVVDGEPRVRDADLGAALGFSRVRKIRDLVKRNIAEVEQFGRVPQCAAHVEFRMPTGGTARRPVTEYWLNEEQALLVSVLSAAPNAPAVRAALIKVFVAWRRGQTAPVTAVARPSHPPISKADWQRMNRIRHSKIELVKAVHTLESLGVDVLKIDMQAVVKFSRFLTAK